MKKIKVYLCVIFFILILLCSSKVKAAGTISLSTSKSTVNVGDEFSVSVNLSGASVATLTARVTVDTSKVDYVSGPSNSSFSKRKSNIHMDRSYRRRQPQNRWNNSKF